METAKSEYANYFYVFNKLGYDTRLAGAKYFFSLLQDVRMDLNEGFSDEELLEKRIPGSMTDEASLVFDVGRGKYKESIFEFLRTTRGEKDEEYSKEAPVFEEDNTIEKAALRFAKYFNAKAKEKENVEGIGAKK